MIGSSTNRVSYYGNGETDDFHYPFKIIEKTDLKLLVVEADGTERLLTSDYFVDVASMRVIYPGYAPGSEPPMEYWPPKLAEGQRLVIYREVPFTQENALDEHWPFNTIEDMVDKVTILCQQLNDAYMRAFKISVALENAENIDFNLPYAPNKSFAWNEDGTALVLSENPADVLPAVKAEVAELREFIIEKEKEIAKLVDKLSGLQLEEVEALRDECKALVEKLEVAIKDNTSMTVGEARQRPTWKYNYGIEE